MKGTTQDRYRVTTFCQNGKMVTMMSEKQVKDFCRKENCKVKTENGLMDISEFKFGYRIVPYGRFNAYLETPDINLIKT